MKITLKKQRGLTLLELLLVVTILSATAMMATFMISDDTSQYRLKETEHKLIALKKAIVNVENYNGMHAISGYVADNGKLPECIQALWDKTACPVAGASALNDYAAVTPRYNSAAADSLGVGIDVGTGPTVHNLTPLYKGFRNTYLPQIEQSGETTFSDGWGNGVDTINTACTALSSVAYRSENHGWCYYNNSGDLTITSYGRDNRVGSIGGAVYDKDSQLNIGKTEWNVNSLQITISNNTGNVYPATANGNLKLALVSFTNNGANDWKQITKLLSVPQLPVGDTVVNIVATEGIAVGQHSLVLFNNGEISPPTIPQKQIDIYPNINNSINWSIR